MTTTTAVGAPAFLSAVLAATEDPFTLVFGEKTADLETFAAAAPIFADTKNDDVYLSPVTTTDVVPFLYTFTENAQRDQWRDDVLAPTAVLFKDDALICVYALETAVTREIAGPLAEAMNGHLDDPIPTPSANGWQLLHLDANTFHPIAVLADLWSTEAPAVVDRPAPDTASRGRYKDATIHTVFDFEDPRLAAPVTVSMGTGVKETNWKPMLTTRMGALDGFCTHRVARKKDSAAMVLGKLPEPDLTNERESNRRNALIEEVWMVGLDFDTGVTGDELAQAMADAKLMGVLASTFSHMTTTTTETYRSFAIWMVETGRAASVEEAVVDRDVVRARMAAEPKKIVPAIVNTMEIEITGEGNDREVVITHAPLPKWRLILPLDRPFIPADHDTADEEGFRVWRGVAPALARRLGGLPFDHACVDPARLWYLPNHPADRPDFRIDLFGGDLLSLDDILVEAAELAEADEPATGRARKSSTTASTGPFNERWIAREGAGFEIVKLLTEVVKPRQDPKLKLVRAMRGKDKVTIRCPFADGHGKRDTNDSAGAFASAPDSGRGEGFTIYCSHGSCQSQKRDRLTYLNKMLADGWFTEQEARAYETIAHDEPAEDADDVDVEAALAEFAGLPPPLKAGNVAISSALRINALEPTRSLFDGPDAEAQAIDAMAKVASVVSLGNKVRIATRTRDGLAFHVKSDAALWFSQYRALLEVGKDKNGDPKIKEFAALDLLLKSDRVARYAGIDCDPTASLPDHILNTWEGIKIAPAPGDCSLLKRHLLESTCAGNVEHNKVLTQFFAHMFLKPGEKPGFAPVVIGPRGAGKSTVADFLRRAIGRRHSVKIAQGKHLTGNFNAHLAGRLLVQAEEVTFGGDKKGEGPLKDAITSPTTLTEPKGFDAYEETSFARFFLVTNPGHAVPAGDGERRWFVLKVRDLFAGTPLDDPARIAYFDAIRAEADAGGIAAFVHYLVNEVDITDFKPWAPPKTDALAEQVVQSLSDQDRWVLDVLESGGFNGRDGYAVGGEEWELDKPLEIERVHVQASFDSYVRSHNGSSGGNGAARRALAQHGDVIDGRRSGGDRKKTYRLAPRREWRARFEERFSISLAGEDEDEG